MCELQLVPLSISKFSEYIRVTDTHTSFGTEEIGEMGSIFAENVTAKGFFKSKIFAGKQQENMQENLSRQTAEIVL